MLNAETPWKNRQAISIPKELESAVAMAQSKKSRFVEFMRGNFDLTWSRQ
jgi:hypothetical protein